MMPSLEPPVPGLPPWLSAVELEHAQKKSATAHALAAAPGFWIGTRTK
jgi:hypothetical protein